MAGEIVDSTEMLRRLVGFDTTSRDSNLALIDYVKDYLADHGVDSTLVPNEEGTKANLYATIGPMVEGGVGSAEEKIEKLRAAGVKVAMHPEQIPDLL